jgi:hypothetical protein
LGVVYPEEIPANAEDDANVILLQGRGPILIGETRRDFAVAED